MGEKKSKHYKDKKRKKSASDSEPGAWMTAVAHMRRCRIIRCHLICKGLDKIILFRVHRVGRPQGNTQAQEKQTQKGQGQEKGRRGDVGREAPCEGGQEVSETA